jgi:hypothetical protein
MKTKRHFITIHAACCLALLAMCTDKEETLPLEITTFSPIKGTAGSVVTINGAFAPDDKDRFTVFFNETQGIVSTLKDNVLTAIVPAGASTGRIKIVGNGIAVESRDDFQINASAAPIITSFAPMLGKAGDIVIVNGTNFLAEPSLVAVSFNGTPAVVIQASADQLSVQVPEAASIGKISVAVFGQIGSSADNFSFIAPPPEIFDVLVNVPDATNPIIGISSTSAALEAAEDLSIVVRGVNFDPRLQGNVVRINNLPLLLYETTSLTSPLGPYASIRNAGRILIGRIPKGASSGNVQITANGITVGGPYIKINDPSVNPADPPIWKNKTVYPTQSNDRGSYTLGENLQIFNKDRGSFHINHFVLGEKAFFFGSTVELLEYELPIDTWTQREILTGIPPIYGNKTATFVIGSKAYIVAETALNGNTNTSHIYEYDPAIGTGGTWKQLAELPKSPNSRSPVRKQSVGFALAGKGYIGGGTVANFSSIQTANSEFYQFSPPDVTNPLGKFRLLAVANFGATPGNPAGVGPVSNALSFVVGTEAFVYTGTRFYKFTPPTNDTDRGVWTLLNTPTAALLNSATESSGFVKNGLIYVGTGRPLGGGFQVRYKGINASGAAFTNPVVNYTVFNKMAVYNPANNTWQATSAFGNGELVMAGGAGFSIGNRGFIGMGYIGAPNPAGPEPIFPTNKIYEFIQ